MDDTTSITHIEEVAELKENMEAEGYEFVGKC